MKPNKTNSSEKQDNSKPEIIDDKEYIDELELLVIFLAGTYTDIIKSIDVVEEKNGGVDKRYSDLLFRVPRIQGSFNRMYLEKIGNLVNERRNDIRPKMSMQDFFNKISEKYFTIEELDERTKLALEKYYKEKRNEQNKD